MTLGEVAECRISFKSSPGPDKVTVKEWNKVPDRAKAKLFTTWLRIAKVPSFVTESRTIFIPKKEEVKSPAELRPISIASVILRHHNKIIAKRLSKVLENTLDEYQFGFRPFDGTAKGLTILDQTIRKSKMNQMGLSMGSIDLKKAFDSVDHYAIEIALRRLEFPELFISYIN